MIAVAIFAAGTALIWWIAETSYWRIKDPPTPTRKKNWWFYE